MKRVEVGNVVQPTPETALGLPGSITPTAYQLTPGLGFEEWAKIGQTLQTIAGSALWWLGDWWLHGEMHYGEEAAQAIRDDLGYSARTVQQAAWVSSRFPISSRLGSVPWSTHMAFAGVEDEGKRFDLLALSAKEKWTVQQARERVRSLKLPALAIAQEGGRSVDLGEVLLTLFEEKGILIVQQRDRRTGVALDRAIFSDEAIDLVRGFLNGRVR